MLQHEMLTEIGVLVARPKGPLSKSDFSALSADADAYIEAHGALKGLMICAEEFPGWENLEGFVAHFRFVRDHHQKIAKVAFVSDSDVLALLPKLASHFVSAEVRQFGSDEEKDALAWLSR
jgi:SpoIIAA-like